MDQVKEAAIKSNSFVESHLLQMLQQMEVTLGEIYGIEKCRDELKIFPHIPYRPDLFINRLKEIANFLPEKKADCSPQIAKRMPGWTPTLPYDQRPTFLDVGCGIGTKLMLARQMGFKVFGVEYNKKYIDLANQLLSGFVDCKYSPIDRSFWHGDALEFNDYSKYDVIYWYTPIIDSQKIARLVKKIMLESKPGTILFPASSSFFFYGYCSEQEECHKILKEMFVQHNKNDDSFWVKKDACSSQDS